MQRRSRRMRGSAANLALVLTLALGVTPAAFGGESASPTQPSAMERLLRHEDAHQVELAREPFARQNELVSMLDARERALAAGLEAVAPAVAGNDRLGLDPAIRTAMLARASGPTTGSVAVAPVGGDAFAWDAAAIGLAAGVAAMCVVLGCVTLVRSHGRLRSV